MARKAWIPTALLALMKESGHHAWTLEAFQAGLAESGASADFSSVFRAAEKLVSEGVLVKVLLDDGRARFELAASHHDHLHCTTCNRIVEFRNEDLLRLRDSVSLAHGFRATGHRFVISGVCPACSRSHTPRRRLDLI